MFQAIDLLTQKTLNVDTGTVAVLPLGAMESHGPHLPLGTDTIIAQGILDRAASLDESTTPVLCLPALWLGASTEHADRAGTLSLEPEALITQIEAVGEGLARAGVKKLLLFNAHGGNISAANIAVLKLRKRFGFLAANVHWLDYGLPAELSPPAPAKEDIHGGWIETSVMLHLAPNLVGPSPAAREPHPPAAGLFPRGPVAWGWMTSDLAANEIEGGWIGWPDRGTAELGRTLVDHAAQQVLTTLRELAAASWSPNP